MITSNDTAIKALAILRAHLACRGEVAAWADSRGFVPFTVASGYDYESEAELKKVPALVVVPGGEEGNPYQPGMIWTKVEARIANRGMETNPDDGHLWPGDISSLAKLLIQVLDKAFKSTNAVVNRVSSSYSVEAWPIISATITLEHKIPQLLGTTQEIE